MTKKFYSLFYVEHDDLVINVPELELIPIYKSVLRDKKLKGEDSKAYKVFAFIWLFANYDSPHINLDDQERFKEAVKDAKLGSSFYPTDEIWAAVERHTKDEEKRFPEMKLLLSLRRGVNVTRQTVDMLTEEVLEHNNEIAKLKISYTANKLNLEQAPVIAANIDAAKVRLMDTQRMLQELQKTLPPTIEKIEVLLKRAKEEISNKAKVRGGGDVYNREDE